MSKFVEVIRNAADKPVEAIQVVVAIIVFVLAVYIALPWFIPSVGSAAAAAFADNWVQQSIVGVVLALPTIPLLLGLFVRKFATTYWYTRSCFWMFIATLFLMLLRVIAVGILPLTWVPTLGLAIITGICWAYWKRNA